MYWKVACNSSPVGAAIKQTNRGILLREISGTCTFYTIKNFPYNNRPATEDELQEETGWIPLTKPLISLR